MRKYEVNLEGLKPGLLMHAHNVTFDDKLTEWRQEPGNKSKSKAGDDRSPAWRWLGYCYSTDGQLCLPTTNISAALIDAAKKTAKKGKETYKASFAAGVLFEDLGWPIMTPQSGVFSPVNIDDFDILMDDDLDFKRGQAMALERGFELHVGPVRVNRAAHIRVRPHFQEWKASGTIIVIDDEIDERILDIVFANAGGIKGLGDWRPSSSKPGPYGRFRFSLAEMK